MTFSLKTKVMLFAAGAVISMSLVSTAIFTVTQEKSIEQEMVARGITMADSLSRAVNPGLASENLEFIKEVEDIVHTRDVVLAQVFTPLWLAVDAYPGGRLHDRPDAEAVAFFKQHESAYYKKSAGWFDFYSPVFYKEAPAGRGNALIGYVRLRLSTAQFRRNVRRAVTANILVSALISLVAVALLNGFIRKYVLTPLLRLHASVSRHKQGEFPGAIPVTGSDEIGELSNEFNQMSSALREREERLNEEKERLSVTLRSIGDGVIVTDVTGSVTLINAVAERHTGWTADEATGRPLAAVFTIINEKTRRPCENPVERVLRAGVIVGLANHTVLIRKDGAERIIEDSAAPIRDRHGAVTGVVLVFRDATEKRRLEEELLKMEKLQSVGLLAGGLAHDFNNILTAIIGNISLAKKQIGPGHQAFARLGEAEAASRRAAELTYQLLTFSRGGAPVRKTVSIADIARESARLTLAGTGVTAEFACPADLWCVEADAGQMSQVFNNLIINAVQAMPHGGAITVSLANVVLGEGEALPLTAGSYVKVSVKDAGTGIPAGLLPRIFDPFFTTKKQGSGLGLASVYSIVNKHDGFVTVESAPGAGTTFHLYLPASPGKAPSLAATEALVAGGQGRVLVMDDEKILRDLSGEILRSLGYEVDFAGNGEEAVEKYRASLKAGAPFAAVIMDLTVRGGMGGKEAIQKLRALDPAVKAIVSSGYSNDPIMADYAKFGFCGAIFKPFSLESFGAALSAVLGRP